MKATKYVVKCHGVEHLFPDTPKGLEEARRFAERTFAETQADKRILLEDNSGKQIRVKS
jgi:hypothetical protein